MTQTIFKKLVSQKLTSDFHMFIWIFLNTQITQKKKISTVITICRFLEHLLTTELSLKTDDPNENYNFIKENPTGENKGLYKEQRNKCALRWIPTMP